MDPFLQLRQARGKSEESAIICVLSLNPHLPLRLKGPSGIPTDLLPSFPIPFHLLFFFTTTIQLPLKQSTISVTLTVTIFLLMNGAIVAYLIFVPSRAISGAAAPRCCRQSS